MRRLPVFDIERMAIAAQRFGPAWPDPFNDPWWLDFAPKALRLSAGATLLVLSTGGGRVPDTPGARICVSPVSPLSAGHDERVEGSGFCLPFGAGAFSAALDRGRSQALSLEHDADSLVCLSELARVLRSGARFLCGASLSWQEGARVSADKRMVSELRREGRVLHQALRLRRADGSWQRLHARYRPRGFDEAEQLLKRAGFEVINAYPRSANLSEAAEEAGSQILLCERMGG
jgi:SAM-dependent methyltransferase